MENIVDFVGICMMGSVKEPCPNKNDGGGIVKSEDIHMCSTCDKFRKKGKAGSSRKTL